MEGSTGVIWVGETSQRIAPEWNIEEWLDILWVLKNTFSCRDSMCKLYEA